MQKLYTKDLENVVLFKNACYFPIDFHINKMDLTGLSLATVLQLQECKPPKYKYEIPIYLTNISDIDREILKNINTDKFFISVLFNKNNDVLGYEIYPNNRIREKYYLIKYDRS
jgi:hypothetical protein